MGRRLLRFLLVIALIASCKARSLPASFQPTNTLVFVPSLMDRIQITCPVDFHGVKNWLECMSSLLEQAFTMCGRRCNVIIYKVEDVYNPPGGPQPYHLSPKTVTAPDPLFEYDLELKNTDRVFLPVVYTFHAVAFLSSAYYETEGWYGWQNWGFIGKFNHQERTNKVEFYDQVHDN